MVEEFILEENGIPEQEILPEGSSGGKKKKGIWILIPCVALLALAAAFFFTAKPRQYARAAEFYRQGEYLQAAQQYEDLGAYKDSSVQAADARYILAEELMDGEDYSGAIALYQQLEDYKDSRQLLLECYYKLGRQMVKDGRWEEAEEYFTLATDDFRDAKDQRLRAIYEHGHQLYLEGQREAAQDCFDRLEGQWPVGCGPHFETFDAALDHIQTQAEALPVSVTVVVENMPGSYILRPDLLNITIQQRLGYQFAKVNYNEKTKALSVFPSYYPGQRIVHAWKNDDFSMLTTEELGAYQTARRLVYQAQQADPDPQAVELWLHDWLCENVEYDSPYEYVYPEDYVGLNELTCVGALLSGRANCQGYTDAFYLLGTMAGLDVCVMFGYAEGGGHCWNGVRLDEKLYMVDVTFNDTYFQEAEYWTYIWYNNILDLDVYDIMGGSPLFPGLVTRKDLSHTYYAYTDSVYGDLGEAAYGLLRQYRKNGAGVYHAVVDSADQTQDDFYKAVANNMGLAGVYSARWYVDLYTYENDTYIWVEWADG